MLAQFIEVSSPDNKPMLPVYINPAHVVRIRSEPSNGERAIIITIIEDVNKQKTRVEGAPSAVRDLLNNPR